MPFYPYSLLLLSLFTFSSLLSLPYSSHSSSCSLSRSPSSTSPAAGIPPNFSLHRFHSSYHSSWCFSASIVSRSSVWSSFHESIGRASINCRFIWFPTNFHIDVNERQLVSKQNVKTEFEKVKIFFWSLKLFSCWSDLQVRKLVNRSCRDLVRLFEFFARASTYLNGLINSRQFGRQAFKPRYAVFNGTHSTMAV